MTAELGDHQIDVGIGEQPAQLGTDGGFMLEIAGDGRGGGGVLRTQPSNGRGLRADTAMAPGLLRKLPYQPDSRN
jgi:hypothetical protein